MSDGSVTIDTKLNNKNVEKGLKELGNIAKSTLKKMAVAVGAGAVTKKIAEIVKASVKARGEMEQVAGGTKKIFDEMDFAKIEKDAKEAYRTMNLSATEYLNMMNSVGATFAKTMGDAKGYDTAKKGMQAIADYASGTGADIGILNEKYKMITRSTTSYLSIADQFAGLLPQTTDGFLKQAQASGFLSSEYQKLNDVPVAEYQQAISAMLEQGVKDMGLYGNTLAETENTLTGSLNALKASWDNFLSGAGDIKQVIDSAEIAMKNLSKTATEAIGYISGQIGDLLKEKLEPLTKWIDEHRNILIVITGILATLTTAVLAHIIAMNADLIVIWAYVTATSVATAVSSAFGAVLAFITSPITLVVLAIGALITIIVLLVKNWDTVKEKTIEIWNAVKEFLGNVINGIIEWFKELPYNIAYFMGEVLGKIIQFGIDAYEWVTQELPKIINDTINWFKQLPGRIWNILLNVLSYIVQWLGNMKSKASQGTKNVVQSIINFFKELPSNMLNIGKNIVEGLWNGIKNAGNWIKEKVKEFAKGILDGMKNALGIQSPSKLFRDQVGKNIALGVGEGFEDNISKVYKQMKSAVDFETQKLSAKLSTTAMFDKVININSSIDGNVELDGNKVGRLVTPVVSRTIKAGGLA